MHRAGHSNRSGFVVPPCSRTRGPGLGAANAKNIPGQEMVGSALCGFAHPTQLPNTDVWSYQPWTFSLEMSGGRVTSIRVADPQFNQDADPKRTPTSPQPSLNPSTMTHDGQRSRLTK